MRSPTLAGVLQGPVYTESVLAAVEFVSNDGDV